MVNLKTLAIKLNVNYLPTSAIEPIGGKQSNLTNLLIESEQNLTIRSGAFQHLVQLTYLNLYNFTKLEFEKKAFKFKNSSNNSLTVRFERCNLQGKSNFYLKIFQFISYLSGESFRNGTFDRVQRSLHILFKNSNISYFGEAVFKSLLGNKQNRIDFFENTSLIDCESCKNYWLIKQEKENQVKVPFCKHKTKKLYDQVIKTKLTQKCK